tara:strand:- start:7621 stop:8040 length:420 start_codon:yes stop_codon:yes gene_type:complete
LDKWQKAHMEVAETYAKLSTAKRAQVGCVIVKDKRIISIGYNGMPSGWDNECEDTDEYGFMPVTKPEVLHAETNAIAKLARSSESGDKADLYVTLPPCIDCAKLIYQSGITRVFYKGTYRTVDGIEFLKQADVELISFQ